MCHCMCNYTWKMKILFLHPYVYAYQLSGCFLCDALHLHDDWKQNNCIVVNFLTAHQKLNLQFKVGVEDLVSSTRAEIGKIKRWSSARGLWRNSDDIYLSALLLLCVLREWGEEQVNISSWSSGPMAALPPPALRHPQITWPLPRTSPDAGNLSVFHLYQLLLALPTHYSFKQIKHWKQIYHCTHSPFCNSLS